MNPEKVTHLAVLISGDGSNLQAILDACAAGILSAKVVVVISNRSDAYGLQRAMAANVPTVIYPKQKDQDRRAYDHKLAQTLAGFRPDWVMLAGWMRLLSSAFLDAFPGRVINLHPALPGTFSGTHAIERAYEAFQRGEVAHTGIMVHLVPDEGVDCGPVLAKEIVPIHSGEPLEALETRVHDAEHRLLVETIQKLTTLATEGRSPDAENINKPSLTIREGN